MRLWRISQVAGARGWRALLLGFFVAVNDRWGASSLFRACRRPFSFQPANTAAFEAFGIQGVAVFQPAQGMAAGAADGFGFFFPLRNAGVRPDAWDFAQPVSTTTAMAATSKREGWTREVWKHLVSLSARWAQTLRVPCAAVNIVVECRGRGVPLFRRALREGGRDVRDARDSHRRDELFHPSWSSPTPPWALCSGSVGSGLIPWPASKDIP